MRIARSDAGAGPATVLSGPLKTEFKGVVRELADLCNNAIVKPDAMADNLWREAVVFVAVGVSWRRHIDNLCSLRWGMTRSSQA